MATTTFSPALVGSSRRPNRIATLARGVVNAMSAARIRRAQAELRRHQIPVFETSLIHGAYRTVRLDEADLLPFNR